MWEVQKHFPDYCLLIVYLMSIIFLVSTEDDVSSTYIYMPLDNDDASNFAVCAPTKVIGQLKSILYDLTYHIPIEQPDLLLVLQR